MTFIFSNLIVVLLLAGMHRQQRKQVKEAQINLRFFWIISWISVLLVLAWILNLHVDPWRQLNYIPDLGLTILFWLVSVTILVIAAYLIVQTYRETKTKTSVRLPLYVSDSAIILYLIATMVALM